MPAPSKNIIWIASYPKSGNTWVRFMLCNLLYGEVQTAAALNRLAPDIHETGASLDLSAPGLLVKTHFACSAELPLLERTSAAIYVVRDPTDVLMSNYHYYRRRTGQADDARATLEEYFTAFLDNRGDPHWKALGMGSWEENVRSWLDAQRPFPVLCVRYEDLSADPRRICTTLAGLLKPGSTAGEVERAVVNSSFERLREIEAADIRERRVGIFFKPYLEPSIAAGVRFMRGGRVGEGAASLAPVQQARLRATFAPLLEQLGYATG
jgi:hypothetical protein